MATRLAHAARLGRFWVWALALAGAPAVAAAHVRWFIEEQHPPRWELLVDWPTAAVVGLTAALYLILRWTRGIVGHHFPNPSLLAHLEPSATTLLAVQTGISLIWFASQRRLFVPNLPLPDGTFGWLLLIGQLAVAFTFVTGLLDRPGALLLAAVYLLGFLVFPITMMLDQVLYLGIALTLVVLGRSIPPGGPIARLLGSGDQGRAAVAGLRLLTGFSILFVAFTEKLLAPGAGLAFLAEYPHFNVPRVYWGWGWLTDDLYVLLAGIAEATLGALLLLGVLTRVVILALWVPFNVAVAFMPANDLLGHLPIFGIMYVLLLYGSGITPDHRDAAGVSTESAGPPDARPGSELAGTGAERAH